METDAMAELMKAISQRPPAPPTGFWEPLIPYIMMLIIAFAAWLKANTMERKTDVAAVKRDETGKTIDKILEDVNSSKSAAAQQITEQQARIVQMSEKIASLESRLTPVITPVAPLLTEAHIEQIAQRVAVLSKTS